MSASKIGDLYTSYTKIIKTNISLEELIGLAQHGTKLPTIISAGYTSQCNNNAWRTMSTGCFLRQAK